MFAAIARFLCRHGWHSWRNRTPHQRHWHLECRRCGKRDLWRHANPLMGYQPVDVDWLDGKESLDPGRPAGPPPNQGSGAARRVTSAFDIWISTDAVNWTRIGRCREFSGCPDIIRRAPQFAGHSVRLKLCAAGQELSDVTSRVVIL